MLNGKFVQIFRFLYKFLKTLYKSYYKGQQVLKENARLFYKPDCIFYPFICMRIYRKLRYDAN